MKKLKFLIITLFLSLFQFEEMKLSYELKNQNGKNFLVINSEDPLL